LSTNQIVLLLSKRYPKVGSYISDNLHKRCSFIRPSLVVAAHYLFGEVDEEQADEFINLLVLGEGLYVGHPVLTLRDRLMRSQASRLEKLSKTQMMRLIILTWNAFREGRTLAKSSLGVNDTKMPTII